MGYDYELRITNNYLREIVMIFLCFSSKDRNVFAESIYYHLSNFGLNSWYDRKEILMGDNREYKNFIEGVESCEYSVIVLSPNSIESICANEEIELIHKRFLKGKTYVFPVFFNILAADIPDKYSWMKKLVYKELDNTQDSRGLCNHIICKVLKDKLEHCPYPSLEKLRNNCKDKFLSTLLNKYFEIDGLNYNARISMLYTGTIYISSRVDTKDLPLYFSKGSNLLFDETKLNLKMDLRETRIFETLFALLVNDYYC